MAVNKFLSQLKFITLLFVFAAAHFISIPALMTSENAFAQTEPATKQQMPKIAPVIERYTHHLKKRMTYVWGIDPFLKEPGYATYTEKPKIYQLQAVIHSETEKSAILDGQEVFVGSVVDDYRVSEIGKNYVILDNGVSLKEVNVPAKPVASHAEIEAIRGPASENPTEENSDD